MTTSDGNVTWLFSAIFKSSCQIKVRYYPFDDQECFLRFASWSHELKELDLKLITDKGDLSSYMNNSEFDLLEMTATREIVPFPTDPFLEWPVIVIRIRMHRRPLFYVFNHILPCVLISSMAVLGFFMPPETGEKINMCITTMLSMGVYLQSITESIPPTSEAVPLIGMYYVASLFMVCLATCVNVITLNVHRNGAANQGRRVPWWMEKYILGYMASLMRMTIHEPDSVALLRTSQACFLNFKLIDFLTVTGVLDPKAMSSIRYRTSAAEYSLLIANFFFLENTRIMRYFQTKGSMIRRSSILRDLKRAKNTENRRGINESNTASGECECRFSAYSMMNRSNEAEVSLLSDPEHIRHGERQYKDYGLDSAFLGRIVKEQLLPRITNQRPQVLNEFEERFRLMLKRIYRSLQQHEIREEILDERKRIMWQWQQLATVVDRFLLVLFFLATVSTVAFFLVLPVTFRSADGQSLFL
uniref:Neurotransmitter-gated ion-channel transmembrane domain-containing protein n=1 Tax=Ascaris lumbricoides TaxID=6252 RepID=A0A9J2Q279_ASCLU